MIDRSLNDYRSLLGEQFRQDLAALGPDDHWLDAGAGELAATRAYLHAGGPAAVTAVSYEVSAESIDKLRANRRARALTRRFLQEIGDEELRGPHGPFKLITDVYGVFFYSSDPLRVLDRYLRLLAPGGRIYIAGADWFTVQHANWVQLGLPEWLARRPELIAKRSNSVGLCIEKRTGDAIPLLKVKHVRDPNSREKGLYLDDTPFAHEKRAPNGG